MDQEVAGAAGLTPAQLAPSLAKVTMRGHWNVDSYAYFMMHLGPILVRHRLPEAHFEHFARLSELVRLTTQVEISHDEVVQIEEGYITWVEEF